MRRFNIRTLGRALRLLAVSALPVLASVPAGAVTPNGRLQIVHLDVGQGDGAVIISPLGEVAMIDNGVGGNPTPACGVKVPAQLQALGIAHVSHHFASHYHADHIGLTAAIFGAGGVATLGYGWDRAESYTTQTYATYVNTLGNKRRTLVKGQKILLDSLSAHPVVIQCVDLGGAGTGTTDENGKCLVLRVTYGEFDMVFGGDLISSVETVVGPAVGKVEAYKVHHHGSAGSSNATFLSAIQPKVAVISCGTGNSYGHPTSSALTRLHNANVKTYWTETGSGVAPNAAWDKVSNHQVVLSATWEPGGVDTVRGNGFAETFANSGTPVTAVPNEPTASVSFSRPAPNPFLDAVRFDYTLRGAGEHVRIDVFDIAGRQVRTLLDELQAGGLHSASWDGLDAGGARVQKGIYFVRAVIAGQPHVMRVTSLR